MLQNFDLVDSLFCRIDQIVQKSGANSLSIQEKAIYTIWHAYGIIGNGGFHYFFENRLNPEEAAKAYEFIGLNEAAECFRLAKGLLPENYKELSLTELNNTLNKQEKLFDSLAQKVLSFDDEATCRLAKLIKENKLLD